MTFNLGAFNKENVNLTRRFEVRLKCPNPLFEKWLEEWRLEAVAKDLDIQHTFKKALKSLRKYPAILATGKQCLILENFGHKLCQKLDQKLSDYRRRFPNDVIVKRSVSPEVVVKSLKIKNGRKKLPKNVDKKPEKAVLNLEEAQIPEKIAIPENKEGGGGLHTDNFEVQDDWSEIPQRSELNSHAVTNVFANRVKDKVGANETDLFRPTYGSRNVLNQDPVDNFTQPIEYCPIWNFDGPTIETTTVENSAHYKDIPGYVFNPPVIDSDKNANKRKCKGKPYVPAVGTAAYALLITLHEHICRNGRSVGMLMNDLKKEAQYLCNVPFHQHLPGSRYTAWSAMGQLCRKLLAIKTGNPPRYQLTAKGIELAEKLKNSTAENNSINDSLTTAGSDKLTINFNNIRDNQDTSNQIDDFIPYMLTKSVSPKRNQTNLYHMGSAHTFSSSDDDDNDNSCKPDSQVFCKAVTNNYKNLPTGSSIFKRNLNVKESLKVRLPKPSCTIVRPPSEEREMEVDETQSSPRKDPSSNKIKEIIDESINKIVEIDETKWLQKHMPQLYESKEILKERTYEDNCNKISYSILDETGPLLKKMSTLQSDPTKSIKDTSVPKKDSCNQNFFGNLIELNSEKNFSNLGHKNTPVLPVKLQDLQTSNVLSQKPPTPSGSQSTLSSQLLVGSISEDFNMLPNQYHTILLIDSSETAGKKSGQVIENKFMNMQIGFEIRHLNVGDYAWICRDVVGNELILPYIIERKRLDDFAKSIKDGRFHEQKFRLKTAPVKQRIYVVEGYGNNGSTGGLPLSTIMQAASNTQLIDGFIVKFTKDYNHTLEYLAILTRKFTNLLNGKILESFSGDELPFFSWKDARLRLMTFKNFMKDASKKKKYSVQEMFVRHLIQLHGISIEKAVAIVDRYPCPRLLLEAYRNGSLNENSLSKIKVGKLERSLGVAISKSIYSLYSQDDFR